MGIKSLLNLRMTKIVCTIGPATSSDDQIRRLILAGMNVARLNFSHGSHDTHKKILRAIRRISEELGHEVGILQDLGGPKIRLGKLPVQELKLRTGEKIGLGPESSSDLSVMPVNYPFIVEDVAVGDRILLADGLVELEVVAKASKKVICRVVVGGVVHSQKGINLPASKLRVPAFTDKDREDLELGLKERVDFVALSFVRREQDLEPVQEIIKLSASRPLLIAKIEKAQAIERLEQILARVDGVMVARGDLGVETPLEEIPIIQKKIIRLARQAGKPVITATQMLRSMVSSPRPTRAEATDVANAVLDGTDALMLSEETAMGEFPVEAVTILDRIARATEAQLLERSLIREPLPDLLPRTESAISRAACWLAEDLQAPAIVAGTSSGSTARLVARFRPPCPVIGLTPHIPTQRQLTLSWGVRPALVETFTDTEHMFELTRAWALAKGIAKKGDLLIVTAGVPVNTPGKTNLLKVVEIH
ncbi:Pyruvate kinase (EC [Olavius algarvensis Delta 1 endosymbiont]|nr:Pyruvate kinase (EC [Olavius algarvensis Delta 1 endosymbiont]